MARGESEQGLLYWPGVLYEELCDLSGITGPYRVSSDVMKNFYFIFLTGCTSFWVLDGLVGG